MPLQDLISPELFMSDDEDLGLSLLDHLPTALPSPCISVYGSDTGPSSRESSPATLQKARRKRLRNGASREAPSCQHCGAQNTPHWRKGPGGVVFCNACGLYYTKVRVECYTLLLHLNVTLFSCIKRRKLRPLSLDKDSESAEVPHTIDDLPSASA